MDNYKLKYAGEKIDELLTKIDNIITGTDTKSGTVKLSSATDSSSGVSDGVAATPAAVKAAYDVAISAKEENARFKMPIGYVFEWSSVPEQSVDLSTPEKVAQYFGYGTWAAFGAGQFLLGAGGVYSAGETGGEATHTLTKDELPNTRLTVEMVFGGTSGSSYYSVQSGGLVGSSPNSADAGFTKPLGSGQAHNNMPPYIVVYRWQRIA